MSPFTSIDGPQPAARHFRAWLLGAVLHVVEQLSQNLGGLAEVLDQFPFVSEYLDEVDSLGAPDQSPVGWLALLHEWEASLDEHLPVRALQQTIKLDDRAIILLFAIGLIEEDPRFGFLIECAQPVPPQQHRPTLGLLIAWWRDNGNAPAVRREIGSLIDHGLIQVLNPDVPRLQWVFQSPPAIWDALRGEVASTIAPSVMCRRREELPDIRDVVLDERSRRTAAALPSLIESGEVKTLLVRGPQHNGRRTVVGAIAAQLGRGVLEISGPFRPDDDRWATIGALATLLHAIPVIVLDLGPGETFAIPDLQSLDGPLAVVLGKYGAVSGEMVRAAVTLNLSVPQADERRALWEKSLQDDVPADLHDLARRFRMTSGNVRTAAGLARSYALVGGRRFIEAADVRVASRSMHREIEALATFVPASGGWESIGASADTLDELRNLESRCRNRERFSNVTARGAGTDLNCGVRALFAGPSGTGKTMAARLLASALQLDLYRLDLGAVVSKYIGETEKTLNRVFSCAEELDVVLLIDEGDALLTSRTAIQSSNDRYANLETNFLLQRLESFEGVLIVTTNAPNRIDSAFQRRMDVVVEFRVPDPVERWTIWQLHLPIDHRVDHAWLEDAAIRCELTGGQIRNAVLQASLLAVDAHGTLSTAELERAVRREYRKAGAVCPLPEIGLVGA